MGWTSYYVGSKSLKDCMADEMAKFPKYNHKIKKSVQKGNDCLTDSWKQCRMFRFWTLA